MKKSIFILILSTLAMFTMSCDEATIAALTEAASALLEKTPGCMQVGNDKYSLEATQHVQDSCAVLAYGCTDATALNFDPTATAMCQTIAANLCCTSAVSGCLDAAATNYNALANTHDVTTCTFNASGSGCLVMTACNYSTAAGYTKDCNGVVDGSGAECCTMPSAAIETCYLDLDNNGFAEVTDSVPAGTCGGCSSKGIGWTDTVNGTEALGCTDPTCIEFNPAATVNNGLCCLTDLDSLVEAGFTEFTTDSSYFEGAEYALLGEYQMSFSSACQQGDMPEGDTEIGTIWLGWGGTYSQEFEHSHVITGFPVEPAWNMADNFNACEAAAAVQSAPFFCANEMSDFDDFTPCTEVYYENECWNNGECSWQYAECRDKPDPTMQACDGATSQSACNAPGCHWEDGNYFDPETGQESQFSEPYCYFDCWNVDEPGCNTLNAGGTGKCEWKVDQNAGGGWSFCAASAATNPGLCAQAKGILQQSGNGDCWWEPDDFDNFGGPGNCSCWIDGNGSEEANCNAAQGFEWKTLTEEADGECVQLFAPSVCDSHTSDNSCWNDWENGCEWDYNMDNDCFQPDWFSDSGPGGCGDNNKDSCIADQANCEWFAPPMPPNAPSWAEDGACMFWDPCHYDDSMGSGWNNKQDCQNDWNCYWSEGQGNEPSGCWENAYEQYCDCRIDWSSTSCTLAGYNWESFGNFGGQCTEPMAEWTCYGGNFDQGEGYIDCDAYHDEDVQRFQVWDGTNCVEVKSESMQGEWYIENNQLCHDKDEMDTDCDDTSLTFEECECMPNCMWQGVGNDPQSWEHNGTCDDFDPNQQPPGNRSISVSENPRINGNNKMFHDTPLLEMLYSLNSSPPDYECLDYTIDTTPGNVGNIIMSQEGGCVVTLVLQQ